MTVNNGKPWSPDQDQHLSSLYRQDMTSEEMAVRLGRTEYAIRCRLKFLGLDPDDTHTATMMKTNDKEPTMKNRTVVTKVFVGNTDASTLSVEQLLEVIEQEQSFISRLRGIGASDAKEKLIKKHTENLSSLEELLEDLV